MKKFEKLSKISFSIFLMSSLLASNFLVFIPEAKACVETVCPPGDIKYEIDEGAYEYTDGTATISGDETTIYWSANEGCTVTNVCIKIGGPGGGSLINPDPSLGQWTTETYGISHIVINTNCEEPGPVCGNGILEGAEECDDGNNIDGDGCSANCTIEQQQCIPEGGSGAVIPGGPECCEGLTQIGCDQPDLTGECSEECVGAFYCTMCGNGICGLGENQCNCPEDCTANIYAYKVVCDAEEYLPNWGDRQDVSMITPQVVNDFVAQNSEYCHLASDWDFEWGRNGEAQKQNGDYVGFAPDGTGWNDFDSSTGADPAQVNLNAQDINSTTQIWVREVLKENYFPFSYPPSNSQDNVSAEMYCHTDVLNYDNYDYIINPQLGQDYYCVAFNALATSVEPYCELQLTKTDNPDPVQPGQDLAYQLTLENTGTADCTGTGVRIKDVFDQNTSFSTSSLNPEQITNTYIKWNLGTLHPGDEVQIDLVMEVSEETQCGTILENKAKYWSSQTGWGEFVIEETEVTCLPPPPVCDPEIELISNGGFELPVVSTAQLWDIFD